MKIAKKETRYDYERQCWIEVDAKTLIATVLPCEHPARMRPNCCYAGSHVGETFSYENVTSLQTEKGE